MTSTTRYTEHSQREFITAVADKVASVVVPRVVDGPWMLATKVHDAIAARPGSDGTERHLCALIEPDDARAVVAADPDNLRDLAVVMQTLAHDEKTPSALLSRLCAVALRWNTAMLLNCQSLLYLDPASAFEDYDDAAPAEPTAAAETAGEIDGVAAHADEEDADTASETATVGASAHDNVWS